MSFTFKTKGAVPTVDRAMSHFNKALQELHGVKAHHDSEAAKHEQTIAEAQAALDSSVKEAARAARTAAKVESFLA